MLAAKDLFLLLAFLNQFQSYKILMKKIYSAFPDLTELFSCSKDCLIQKGLTEAEVEKIKIIKDETCNVENVEIEQIKETLRKNNTCFLAFCEENYPQKLRDIDDPPLGLFYKGNIEVLNCSRAVAIVGTRGATNYGLSNSKKIASLLAKREITVVSGLASGIDSSAHIGALGAAGKTIAVLGNGVDIAFPSSNRELFDEILASGNLIVSEYPVGAPPLPWNFPQRNRIISAVSDAVIVIEGDVQSGALITARFAIKQDKPLFALPGPVDSPSSNGPNILIKSKVAELLTSVEDILEVFGEVRQTSLDLNSEEDDLSELNKDEKNICQLLSSGSSKSFDSLQNETKLDTKELVKLLSILELKGYIEKTMDGGYIRL